MRAQAVAVLGDLAAPAATVAVATAIDDPAPRVRLRAALASHRLPSDGARERLVARLSVDGDDPVLRHGLVWGLLRCADEETLERLAASTDRRERLAALLVWRRTGDPALARFFDDTDDALVLEAARAVHDELVADALPALADRLDDARWLGRFGGDGTEGDADDDRGDDDSDDAEPLDPDHALLWRRALNAAYREGGEARARSVLAFAEGAAASADLRAEALELLGAWAEPEPLDRITGFSWPLPAREDGVVDELVLAFAAAEAEGGLAVGADTPDEVVRAWAELAQARADEHPQPRALAERLAAPLADTDRDDGTRRALFDATVALLAPLPDGEAERLALLDAALGDPSSELRAAGLEALRDLDPALALPRVPALLEQGELPERRAALGILADAEGAQVDEARALLDGRLGELVTGTWPAELRLDLVLAAEELLPRAEGPAAEDTRALLAGHHARLEGDDELLAPWVDGLFGGDADAGRGVFERNEMQCQCCHVSAGDGPTVGPELAGVGRRLARRQILASILDPNRRIAPGYLTERLTLTDGESVAGRVLGEADGTIRIQDAEGEVTEVRAEDVVARRPSISAMPEGLAAALTREEMRDLIEYVAGL